MTPPPDKPFFFGWLCILTYYGALTLLTERYPAFRSHDPHIDNCVVGHGPNSSVEWVIMGGFCFQIVAGVATWNTVRVGMDILAVNGDATTNGLVRVETAVAKYRGVSSPWLEDAQL